MLQGELYLYLMYYVWPRDKASEVPNLTSHLYLLPRSRISEAFFSLPYMSSVVLLNWISAEVECACIRMEKRNGFYVTCCGKYTFDIEIRNSL
jgi:hypothetical protein